VLHFRKTSPDLQYVSRKGPVIATPASSTDSAPGVRLFAAVTGLTSLAILVQAVTAGQFISKRHQNSWIDAHTVTANVAVVLALITVIAAWRLTPERRGPLLVGSIVLFVLVVLQTILGHLISDGHHPAILVIHVPIALLVFGLTVWLSVQAAFISRAARLGT
jgi:lipopolysaccharide export LptBFGC system permease protein LptF